MATILQFRRGTASEAAAFTGAAGELFVDATNFRLYIHDGVTLGGHPVDTTLDGQALSALINSKQDRLVSGTSIKTVNGTSLLGAGNIVISGGTMTTQEIQNALLSGSLNLNDVSTWGIRVVEDYVEAREQPQVGTAIVVTQDMNGNTGINGNGLFLTETEELLAVQPGWTIRFQDGTTRIANGNTYSMGNGQYVVGFDENLSLDPAFPVSIESPDYAAAFGGKTLGVIVNGSIWRFNNFNGLTPELVFPDNTVQTTAWTGNITETLDSVTDRNATTSNIIEVGGLVSNTITSGMGLPTGSMATSSGANSYGGPNAQFDQNSFTNGSLSAITPGWTVSDGLGWTATITQVNAYSIPGMLVLDVDQSWTQVGPYYFYGTDYVPASASDLTLKIGQNGPEVTLSTDGRLMLGTNLGMIHTDQTTGAVTIGDFVGPEGQPAMPSTTIRIGGNDNALTISRGNGSNNPTWKFGDDGSVRFPDQTLQTTAYTGQASQVSTVNGQTGDVLINALPTTPAEMLTGLYAQPLAITATSITDGGSLKVTFSGSVNSQATLDDETLHAFGRSIHNGPGYQLFFGNQPPLTLQWNLPDYELNRTFVCAELNLSSEVNNGNGTFTLTPTFVKASIPTDVPGQWMQMDATQLQAAIEGNDVMGPDGLGGQEVKIVGTPQYAAMVINQLTNMQCYSKYTTIMHLIAASLGDFIQ